MKRSMFTAAMLSCLVSACTKPSDDPAQGAAASTEAPTQQPTSAEKPAAETGEAEAQVEAQVEAEAQVEPEPKVEAEAQVEAEAETGSEAEPAAEDKVVPVTVVAPTQATVSWREAATPTESISFINLHTGVLARSASGYHDLDDAGQLVLREAIEAPQGDLIGDWPNNAWYVETKTITAKNEYGDDYEARSLRLMRLRNNQRWVPQEYRGEQRFVGDKEEVRVGAKGGLLVREEETITRVAGGTSDPPASVYEGDEVMTFVETNSGRIYLVSTDWHTNYVQTNCEDRACADAAAVALPFEMGWSFPLQTARQRHSVSLAATVKHEEATKHHLLHYETGGWKLEALNDAPTGLWATKDGGLWVIVGSELWHRDPDGGWRIVALPEGATAVSAAMLPDRSELWIASTVGGKSVVHATGAKAQEPAQAVGGQ